MSASLVGSEMCIRDSPFGFGELGRLPLPACAMLAARRVFRLRLAFLPADCRVPVLPCASRADDVPP
eukprot:4073180-Alexandrium_andersonii.AAC.1